MAITKTHPIRSTVGKALEYILNPEKTDEMLLVSSFACSPETADMEFAWTREQAASSGNQLARHFIQSFEPGEATPEQAHEIGMRLMEEILGGRFEFVLATHVDKGHIHNHAIWNAVSFADHKKYRSNRTTYRQIREASDRLCAEYGLSVIQNPGKTKGQTIGERAAIREGRSWKAKLKATISAVLPQAKTYPAFLSLMKQAGYEVRQGKHLAFRAPGQKNFTYMKSLGAFYEDAAVRARIEGTPLLTKGQAPSLMLDLENSLKAQQSPGYAHWAKLHNLKLAAKTVHYLSEHGIESYAALFEKAAALHETVHRRAGEIREIEQRMADISIAMKYKEAYGKFRSVYEAYRRAPNREAYRRQHERELILYEAAVNSLNKLPDELRQTTGRKLREEYLSLLKRKNALYPEYTGAKEQEKELRTVKANIDQLLKVQPTHEQQKKRELPR